jgi:hypothetical protein
MFVELNFVVKIIIDCPHMYRIYYVEVLHSKFCDLEILEMLGTKAMDVATPLWPSVRMKLTLPKLGTSSPLGLLNF